MPNASRSQWLSVKPATADRHRARAGLALGDERLDRVPERRVERRARAALRLEELELVLDVAAEHRADHRLDPVRVLARQQPAVDGDLAERRNHVALVARRRSSSARRSARAAARRARRRSGPRLARRSSRDRRRRHLAEHRAKKRLDLRAAAAAPGRNATSRSISGAAFTSALSAIAGIDAWPERPCTRRRNGALIFSAVGADVEDAAAELEPVARALVDRVVAADGVGVLLAEPLQAEPVADLLVGGRRRRSRSPAGRKPSRASDAIATALAATCPFMSSAPRPQTSPSRSSPENGGTDHSARVGEHDVGVREQQQRRPVAAARDPRDEVRALGHARVQLALDAVRLEVVAQQLGGRASRCRADSSCRSGCSRPSRSTTSSRRAVSTTGRSILRAVGDLFSDAAERRAGELAPLAQRLRPRVARRVRRPGARARRGLGAAAGDRRGPRPLVDLLRPARQREDDARPDRRGVDRRGVRGAVGGVGVGEGRARDPRPRARAARCASGRRTILFLDEIHRFNKAQQDALLPAVEDGPRHADRRDDGEPVLRGQLRAALALPDLRARVADARRTCRRSSGAARPSSAPSCRRSSSSSSRAGAAATRGRRSTSSSSPSRPRAPRAGR